MTDEYEFNRTGLAVLAALAVHIVTFAFVLA